METKQPPQSATQSDAATPSPEDPRKPYEAPRLLKKRSVARATLFSAGGAMMATGLVTMG
jgi:hypothetical protein